MKLSSWENFRALKAFNLANTPYDPKILQSGEFKALKPSNLAMATLFFIYRFNTLYEKELISMFKIRIQMEKRRLNIKN